MSVSKDIVWEIDSGSGSSQNGGGFNPTSAGTDKTYGGSAGAVVRFDLAADGSSNVSSAGTPFTNADSGNVLQVLGGVGWTPGFYEILTNNAGSITLLGFTGTTLTGGSGTVGGALRDINYTVMSGVMASGNVAYVKKSANPYLTSVIISPLGGVAGKPTAIVGYNSVRGDGDDRADFANCPTIQNNGSSNPMVNLSNNSITFRNFILDGKSSVADCLDAVGASVLVKNCLAKSYTTRGMRVTSSTATISRCGAVSGVAGASAGFNLTSTSTIMNSVAYANQCPGFILGNRSTVINCISANNLGSTSDGFQQSTTSDSMYIGCVSYNNGRDGIRFTGAGAADSATIRNCILANNTGYGINSDTTNYSNAIKDIDYNAYFANGSGAINNIPSGEHAVLLSYNPFNNAGLGDFSLTTQASGGLACRGAGYPGALPVVSGVGFATIPTISYIDIGAAQHTDGGGTGWTENEKSQIRQALGLLGTKLATAGGNLDNVNNVVTYISGNPATGGGGGNYSNTLDLYISGVTQNINTNLTSTRAAKLDLIQAVMPADINKISGVALPSPNVAGYLPVDIIYVSGQPASMGTAPDNASITAIKAQTDKIPSNPAYISGVMRLDLVQPLSPSNSGDTVGGGLLGARAQAFGKWVIVGSGLTLFSANDTPIKTLWLSPTGAPIARF